MMFLNFVWWAKHAHTVSSYIETTPNVIILGFGALGSSYVMRALSIRIIATIKLPQTALTFYAW